MDTVADAASYDAMDHTQPNEAFVGRLIELGAHGRMLDIGTGPGHVPVMVCGRVAGCSVVGVDLSNEMLKIARRRVRDAGCDERVLLLDADAKDLPFEDHSFDTVFSNTILHHIPDPRPFLREAYRVLRPGGVLLIRDLYRPADRAALDKLVAQHAGACDADQQRLFAESLHAALTPAELRGVADACGLTDCEIVVDTDRHMSLQRRCR